MAKKERHIVRGECPHCACGDVSFIPSETMKEKYIGPDNEVEILCPTCGTKHKGKLVIEEEKS
ncbi:hypothetical protein [Desulforhabdus sp. TSK]|uniref:hypothetical protein n=1 Tax=Desulforhabdus sp. TSK TaxID=2925014 RepID=UPI001FC87DF9|nr:hypothetical protein [Desulforhabdus sp. TSK]GKT09497.1 hypothetical protein DSTSK_28020 [Desulforhabdus sp. TSK]